MVLEAVKVFHHSPSRPRAPLDRRDRATMRNVQEFKPQLHRPRYPAPLFGDSYLNGVNVGRAIYPKFFIIPPIIPPSPISPLTTQRPSFLAYTLCDGDTKRPCFSWDLVADIKCSEVTVLTEESCSILYFFLRTARVSSI